MGKHDARPLRTVLFCAGSEEADIVAGWNSGADSIVIDLEEPCTPISEAIRENARALVKSFLAKAQPGPGKPLIFVRVQPVSTGQTLKDLRAVIGEKLAGVLVPKIESPADVHGVDALLNCLEAEQGIAMGHTMIYPILETAQALRLAYEIGTASPRVSYMGGAISRFGDIHQAIGFRCTPDARETLFLRSKVLIDAKAAGIKYPISGMWTGRLDDEAGLRAWCTELRNLGYYGMMIGNPRLIPVVHECFSPSAEELAYWKRLDRLQAEAERTGSRVVDGDVNQGEAHIVHPAHVGSARKNLAWAKELGLA
ncbi:MAG TPA: aldolase/citrate lyase family protein [Alphaproteobacteria bacterium]|nr:aldolase/citrate lyase family protein [Alphaproteobacteria bacterium]